MKRDSSESAGIKQRKSPFEADLELEILPWQVAFNRKDSSATSTMEPEDSRKGSLTDSSNVFGQGRL